MINKQGMVALGIATLMGAVQAQDAASEQAAICKDSSWNVSIGVSYRKFDDAKFKRFGAPSVSGVLIDDNFTPMGATAATEYIRQNGTLVDGAFRSGYFLNVSGAVASNSGEYESSDCFGPAISASYSFLKQDKLSLSATIGYQYFNIDAKASGFGGSQSSEYWEVARVGDPIRESANVDYFYSAAKAEVELDLYAFDLGVRADLALSDALSIFANVGPTITYADMDSAVAAYLGGADYGTAVGGSDSSTYFVFGLFAAAGVSYWFNDAVGIAFEARYDLSFDDVSTHYASQDLDSFGGALKVQFAF